MVFYKYIWSSKIIIAFLCWINTSYVHPHYVGVTELEYVEEKKQFQIACKWFIDDLEDALRFSGRKYDLTRQYQNIKEDSVVLSYINQHVEIHIDGRAYNMNYIGAETEKGSLWTYWSIKNIGTYKSVRFSNNIFCELHADQIHLVHFTQNNKKESRKLTCKESVTTFLSK